MGDCSVGDDEVMSGTVSFERLAAEAKEGCDDSLGELFQRLRPYMLSVANDLVGSSIRPKCSGSDLVQDATINATKHFHRFEGATERDLLRWIVAILKHRMVDVQRSYVTSAKRNIRAEQPLDTTTGVNSLVASETLTQQHRINRLLVHIDLLPESSRQVVQLHYREGLSFAEIGKVIGVSHEGARKRWRLALRELESLLADELD